MLLLLSQARATYGNMATQASICNMGPVEEQGNSAAAGELHHFKRILSPFCKNAHGVARIVT